jgi:uncharacterized membrane protein (DUF485 family)
MRIADLVQRIIPPLWCGMVLAIAFLEAPLKFRAPNVTRAIGLGIGKLVFTALNRVECALALALGAALFVWPGDAAQRKLFAAVAAILLLQTFWLVPALVRRADAWMRGETPPASRQHLFYVVAEAAKVILLLALSVVAR